MGEKEKSEFDISFGKAINWSSLSIILVSLSGLVWIITYLTLHEVKPIKNDIIIEAKIAKNDTITRLELDNYLKKVDQRISELQNVDSNLNKKIEEINTFYKFLGTVLAIIIAITGFFGFKSLHELKIRNLENAKEVAKNEANSKVETELLNLKENVKNAIELAKNEAKMQTLSEFYESQTEIEILSGNINEINDRLDTINDLENLCEDLKIRVKFVEEKFIESTSNNVDEVYNKNTESTENEVFEDEKFGEEGFENKK
jgi:hypothetical protein